MKKKIIATDAAPKAIGTYSQAASFGNILFVSGQIGIDPNTMEFVSDNFTEQSHQVFKNLRAIIVEARATLSDIIKLNVSVINMAQFPDFNEVMQNYFEEPYPARALVGVRELPKDALVEVEAIVGLNA